MALGLLASRWERNLSDKCCEERLVWCDGGGNGWVKPLKRDATGLMQRNNNKFERRGTTLELVFTTRTVVEGWNMDIGVGWLQKIKCTYDEE